MFADILGGEGHNLVDDLAEECYISPCIAANTRNEFRHSSFMLSAPVLST